MCWVEFMDPQFSTKHAQFIREHPDVLTTGMVTEEQERRLERCAGLTYSSISIPSKASA
jgi:hypothetical protein